MAVVSLCSNYGSDHNNVDRCMHMHNNYTDINHFHFVFMYSEVSD